MTSVTFDSDQAHSLASDICDNCRCQTHHFHILLNTDDSPVLCDDCFHNHTKMTKNSKNSSENSSKNSSKNSDNSFDNDLPCGVCGEESTYIQWKGINFGACQSCFYSGDVFQYFSESDTDSARRVFFNAKNGKTFLWSRYGSVKEVTNKFIVPISQEDQKWYYHCVNRLSTVPDFRWNVTSWCIFGSETTKSDDTFFAVCCEKLGYYDDNPVAIMTPSKTEPGCYDFTKKYDTFDEFLVGNPEPEVQN